MDPYYEIVKLMRSQTSEKQPFAQGTVQTDPLGVSVLGELLTPCIFAGGIVTGDLSGGESCLVYMGEGEYVVLAVWNGA